VRQIVDTRPGEESVRPAVRGPVLSPRAVRSAAPSGGARAASLPIRLGVLVDGTMVVLAAVAAYVAAGAAGAAPAPTGVLVGLPLLTLAVLAKGGIYRSRLRIQLLDDLVVVLVSATVAAAVVLSVGLLWTGDASIGGDVLRQWLFSLVYLAAGRTGLSVALSRARRDNAAVPVLVVGAGEIGRLVARRLRQRPELGLRPVAFLDSAPPAEAGADDDLPVLREWDAERVLTTHGVGQVLIADSRAPERLLLELIRHCNRMGVQVAFVPRLFEAVPADVEIDHVGGLPLVSVRPSDPRSWRFSLKYAFDRVAAAAGILLLAPVLLAAALAVRISLGKPILFKQVRVGLDGRPFAMLKFRTMREGRGPDEPVQLGEDTAPGGVEGDDRRTPLGRFLRRTSIDELPQLFNVLRGEMSLVGPRPERPEFVSRFERSVHRYEERHRVKAGITGWAQIAGLRGKTSLRDRVEWDNWYIENWSAWLDVKILLLTVAAVWKAKETE